MRRTAGRLRAGKGGVAGPMLVLAAVGAAAGGVAPLLLLYLVGATAPAAAAAIVEADPRRRATLGVAALSLGTAAAELIRAGWAGLPWLIFNPYTWLAVYGAAALGWGLHYLAPYVAEAVLEATADWRRARLRRRQQALVELWGEEVADRRPPPG